MRDFKVIGVKYEFEVLVLSTVVYEALVFKKKTFKVSRRFIHE